MSWFSNNGTVGVGFMDLENKCYFSEFQSTDNTVKDDIAYQLPNFYKFENDAINDISKSNRYPNGQNPGNLWYHDHAMRLTNYNAGNGLSGMYIIRNQSI